MFTANIVGCLFGDARPIDIAILVVDVLVLALIRGEAAISFIRWRSKRAIISQLRTFLTTGQDLCDRPPSLPASEQDALAWQKRAQDWITVVRSFFEKKAKPALTVFNHSSFDPQMHTFVSHYIEATYLELCGKLKTLLTIIEKSDAYFE